MTAALDNLGELGPYDLEIRRFINAPASLIWKCWTEAEHLKQWFAPKPVVITTCDIDPRPGGRFHIVMRTPDGAEFPVNGVFLELQENRRIAMSDCLQEGWRPAEKPFFSAVVDFIEQDGGTHYIARALHKDEENRKTHEEMGFHEGWGTCISQLADLAEGMK